MITVLNKTLDWLRKQEDCFERNILINTVENIKENIYNGNVDTVCTYNLNSTNPDDWH